MIVFMGPIVKNRNRTIWRLILPLKIVKLPIPFALCAIINFVPTIADGHCVPRTHYFSHKGSQRGILYVRAVPNHKLGTIKAIKLSSKLEITRVSSNAKLVFSIVRIINNDAPGNKSNPPLLVGRLSLSCF